MTTSLVARVVNQPTRGQESQRRGQLFASPLPVLWPLVRLFSNLPFLWGLQKTASKLSASRSATFLLNVLGALDGHSEKQLLGDRQKSKRTWQLPSEHVLACDHGKKGQGNTVIVTTGVRKSSLWQHVINRGGTYLFLLRYIHLSKHGRMYPQAMCAIHNILSSFIFLDLWKILKECFMIPLGRQGTCHMSSFSRGRNT